MSSNNRKLPPLPKAAPAPKSSLKNAPLRSTGVSNIAGLNTGGTKSFNFGRPSQGRSRSSQTGNQWSNLVSNAVSGGALTSLAGFGSGFASIIGGLTSLFGGGGKTTPPALVEFSLPTSQQQVITIGGAQLAAGNYGGPQSAAPTEIHSAQIIQTVKQALLNSSSLNDVIAEI